MRCCDIIGRDKPLRPSQIGSTPSRSQPHWPRPRSSPVVVAVKFNVTSTPKGSYRAKTGDNGCKVNSNHYSLSTALCESIRYQAKQVIQNQVT